MAFKKVGDVLLAYVDEDMNPVAPASATFVKILYPDGRRVFATVKPGPLEGSNAT